MRDQAITSIRYLEDVSIVTFQKVPAESDFLSYIFERVASLGICVDMISQSTPKSDFVSLSFTTEGDSIGELLTEFASVTSRYPSVRPLINSGNVKINVFGENMRETIGVAARTFQAVKRSGGQVLLVTTGDLEIAILVSQGDFPAAYEELKKEFGL